MSPVADLIIPEIAHKVRHISERYYGDHVLDAINGAGQINRPKLALVFINPTHRNLSADKQWVGLKAPWIGCTNIWQLFRDAGLIDGRLADEIQRAKTSWSEEFAQRVYSQVAARSLYITNMVKWAGLDAKLPERQKIQLYAPVLLEELRIIRPKLIIVFGQLTFDGLLRELGLKSPRTFGGFNEHM